MYEKTRFEISSEIMNKTVYVYGVTARREIIVAFW